MRDIVERGEIAFVGLSLSSSWGNGHATTYRALLRGLAQAGRRALFLERDVPWYAENRDLPDPDFCELALYRDLPGLIRTHGARLRAADAVIVGSYVPEGAAVIDAVAALDPRALCFYDIDTPVTLEMLERGEETHLARRQVPLFDIYFSFSGGRALTLLERRHGARRALPLHCAVDPERHAPRAEAEPRWDLGYLGTYSPDRQPTLDALLLEPARRLPSMRFVVAGSRYPDDIAWPKNVERIEHVPPDRHAAFYAAQRFTLNVTRDAMRRLGWSPSVRLFEAAACGVPVISDDWEGIDDILPREEAILIARDADEATRILAGTNEPRRRAIADAARRRVLGRHDGVSRARELIRALDLIPEAA